MKTKFLKTSFLITLGIFLISMASASLVYADWSDGSHEIVITQGQSVSFTADFFSMHPPMDVSAVLYDSSDNAIYTFVDETKTTQEFSETYTITPSIYLTTGTFELIINETDGVHDSDSESLMLIVSSIPTTDNLPVITLNGANPVTIQVGSTYADAGATATDVEDGTLTSSIVVSNSVNTNLLGVYSVTYSVTDSNSNTVTATRTVRVVDTTIPVITLNGANPVSTIVGQVYTDAGATATDNYDVSVNVVADTTAVNTAVIGTYTVTYTATDSSGNQATPVTRTVNVVSATDVDVTAPVITILSPTNGLIYDTHVTVLQFRVVDDNLASCTYSVLGGAQNVNVPCISGQTINVSLVSQHGSNTWTVYAMDSFGNNSTLAVSFTITEDDDSDDDDDDDNNDNDNGASGNIDLEDLDDTAAYMEQYQPDKIVLGGDESKSSWFQNLIQAIINFFKALFGIK